MPAAPLDVVRRVLARSWRSGIGDVPPAVLPYLVQPWVIATDRLEAIGWRPAHTNEETLLETHDALGAEAIPTVRIAAAAGGAVAARRRGAATRCAARWSGRGPGAGRCDSDEQARAGRRSRVGRPANRWLGLLLMLTLGLVVLIVVALGFDFTNGFHDAANAVAVSITTRALSPMTALAWRRDSTSSVRWSRPGRDHRRRGHHLDADRHPRARRRLRRAHRRDHLEPDHLALRPPVVVDARPHRRPRRCGVASGTTVQWESLVDKVVIPMLLSPVIGLGLGYLLMVAILWLFRRVDRRR